METVYAFEREGSGWTFFFIFFFLKGVDECKLGVLGKFCQKSYLWNEKEVHTQKKRFSPGNCYSSCHSKGLRGAQDAQINPEEYPVFKRK